MLYAPYDRAINRLLDILACNSFDGMRVEGVIYVNGLRRKRREFLHRSCYVQVGVPIHTDFGVPSCCVCYLQVGVPIRKLALSMSPSLPVLRPSIFHPWLTECFHISPPAAAT